MYSLWRLSEFVYRLKGHYFFSTEGRRHGAGILHESGLIKELKQHCNTPDGESLCIYGDIAYPIRPHLQRSYKNNGLSNAEKEFNKAMSSVRCPLNGYLVRLLACLLMWILKRVKGLGCQKLEPCTKHVHCFEMP